MSRSAFVVLFGLLAFAVAPRAQSPWGSQTIDLLVDTVEDQASDATSVADCTDSTSDGDCSLREAIEAANADPALDIIGFDIPAGGGVATIVLSTPMPVLIDEGILIDGYTQLGSSPRTVTIGTNAILAVELTYNGVPTGSDSGLRLNAPSITIRGLALSRLGTQIVALPGAAGARIQGNYIGTSAAGEPVSVSWTPRSSLHDRGTHGQNLLLRRLQA